jgi:hypothetical protein
MEEKKLQFAWGVHGATEDREVIRMRHLRTGKDVEKGALETVI